jgi:hypothetical protein
MSEGSEDVRERRCYRTLRLIDLTPHEIVIVKCECGRIIEWPEGTLQRRYRLRSDFLIWDLQFRVRCKQCRRKNGFVISIQDVEHRGDSSRRQPEHVIVGKR